jgi:hypothetical protein
VWDWLCSVSGFIDPTLLYVNKSAKLNKITTMRVTMHLQD